MSCQHGSTKFYILGKGDLSEGVRYGYVLDDCCHSRDTVVSGILCSASGRRTDTYTASDCRDCNSISAFDWKTYLEWRQKIAFTDRIEPPTTRAAEKKKD